MHNNIIIHDTHTTLKTALVHVCTGGDVHGEKYLGVGQNTHSSVSSLNRILCCYGHTHSQYRKVCTV